MYAQNRAGGEEVRIPEHYSGNAFRTQEPFVPPEDTEVPKVDVAPILGNKAAEQSDAVPHKSFDGEGNGGTSLRRFGLHGLSGILGAWNEELLLGLLLLLYFGGGEGSEELLLCLVLLLFCG